MFARECALAGTAWADQHDEREVGDRDLHGSGRSKSLAQRREGAKASEPIDDADDAILDQCRPEIDEQAELHFGQLKVSKKLLLMNGRRVLDRFQFQNQLALHDEIRAEALVKFQLVVTKRNGDLPADLEPTFHKFILKNASVNRFQESRSQTRVDVITRVDNDRRDFILCHT